MQTYFHSNLYTNSYDEASHSIIRKWHMPPLSAEFREAMNDMLLSMKRFKTGKEVVDVTNFGTLHPDDQEWTATEWTEKAIKEAGYSHLAIILASDVYSQMALKYIVSSLKNNMLNVAYFDNMEEAIEWIKQF